MPCSNNTLKEDKPGQKNHGKSVDHLREKRRNKTLFFFPLTTKERLTQVQSQ